MRKDSSIQTFHQLALISEREWNELSAPNFPFSRFEYLIALEKGGAVGGKSGWSPVYLTAFGNGKLQGASYLYVKEHSYGEYIFDWAWAEAYQRHGFSYFPKLLSSVPFTPATGPKFLLSASADRGEVASLLLAAAIEQMEALNHSSLHYLFISPEEVPWFERAGFLIRHSFQYHWANAGYSDFSEFLNSLKSRKRKQILRERAQLQNEKVSISALTGDALRPEHADIFYKFYFSTITKMGAIGYLTEAFFTEVFERMRDRIVLFLAHDAEGPIAGSLCYFQGDTLFGRYWGANREVKNLHFELCYYQPIEWAIAHGLSKFEAGAQGEHKVARGFLPTLTYSAHWIRHPQFRDAISRFIAEEKNAIQQLFDEMKSQSPFAEV